MREIYDFNFKWAFSKEAAGVPEQMPENWNWVNLPHTWNAIDGQDGGSDYYRGTAYYAKSFSRSDLTEGKDDTGRLYYLEFAGANSSATVYVNGKKLVEHDGGYSTFRVNITDALADENLVVVAVDNAPNRRVYPQKADFTFYGGLYRKVSIISVDSTHFDLDYYGGPGIKVTPVLDGTDAKVSVETYVTNEKDGQKLRYTIKEADETVVETKIVFAKETEHVFDIYGVHRWNGRKDPYLYTAEVELLDGEEVIDRVSARFGCREFAIDPEKGFFLNGESYPLHGVSRHQDRWGIGNALLPEHHEEDIELIMELGANTIRLAHYQHDQYFYDLCDEKGLVIWAEIPYISEHMPTGRENTISQMKELIIQNYNHPSIVVWGLSNEITMSGASDEDLRENHVILNDMVHEMDKTRLTTMAVVSMCDINDPYIEIPDCISYNHYFGWYGGDTSMNGPWMDHFHEVHPDIAIGMSEYGCEGLNWHTSDPQQGDYTEEYQAYYHEELIKQLFTRPYIWSTHVWNMFDFGCDARNEGGESGQNHKGLVTFDRKYKKDAFYAYKAWLSDEPFVHLCGKRYIDRVEDVTKVTVYSNQKSVELFANGESLGKKEAADHFFYFEVPNKGDTKLLAVAGECRDESVIRKVEKFNDAYRLKENSAILNWFDITAPEGYFSLNDRIDAIMTNTEGAKLLGSMFRKMTESKKDKEGGAFEMSEGMMKMMGSFTLIRLIGMMGVIGATPSKEELLGLNAMLNQIKK
ncbi:glycoside hydrolase family 2 protein [bacterium]|nr:glycoside hydrolase family 2 protein [bacterium]